MGTLHPFASDFKLSVSSEKVIEGGGSFGVTVASCFGHCIVMMWCLEPQQPFSNYEGRPHWLTEEGSGRIKPSWLLSDIVKTPDQF